MSAVMSAGKWRIKPSGKLPIFLRFVINSSFHPKITHRLGFKNDLSERVFVKHMMYWPAKKYNAFENEILAHLRRNDGWLEKFARKQLRNSEYLYSLGPKFKKTNWRRMSNGEIKRVLDKLLKDYRDVMCAWYTQYSIDLYFEKTIETELEKYISPDHPDFRKFVLIFTDPKAMTEVAEERWQLLRLAKKFRNNKEKLSKLSSTAKKDIEKHLDKYAYINRGLATSKPYTFRDIVNRIKEAWESKEDINDLIYYSSDKKNEDDYLYALRKIKPNAKFKKIIERARLHSYMRNRRVEAWFMADYGASFMYHEIARRSKFNPDWIMEVTVQEMYGALEGKRMPDEKEMKRRLHDYAMIVKNAETTLITNPAEVAKVAKKYSINVDKVTEIKGNVACLGGLIKGRAKVCLDKKEIGKVKRGDILVAQFTTPDFVPAMEKAAAVVADQGGLSSHAAIVSRELGVPCVIGTKNGTRIIKDNDMLEVNAKTGLVKIMKS